MNKKRIIYVPLESYVARYTYQLRKWNEMEFQRLSVPYMIIEGKTLNNDQVIRTGQVLDAHNRTFFALSQMMDIIEKLRDGDITKDDVIFFEDMFHPGLESLPYIFDQSKDKPSVFVRCLAQTIDPDDFVHSTGMARWMKYFEKMSVQFIDGVLCASEEMIPNIRIADWGDVPLYVTGLPFGKKEVQKRVNNIKPFNERKNRVVFAARWDSEKQPRFFLDLISEMLSYQNDIEFAVLSGGMLKSNDPSLLKELREYASSVQNVKIYENLSKNDYYNILNDSKVLFNCALQDWVSNTVSEADALGCNVLYPAYRSFPETFANDQERLYIPWSLEDAKNKLLNLTVSQHKNIGKISDYQDKTIERTIGVLQGNGGNTYRPLFKYRENVSQSKF